MPKTISLRNEDDEAITHKNGIGIYGLRVVHVKETEHMYYIKQQNNSNDTIYNTLLAQRQPRVKLLNSKNK